MLAGVVTEMLQNMRAIAHPGPFPQREEVKKLIEDNDGNVPLDLVKKLERGTDIAQMKKTFTGPFTAALDKAIVDTYGINLKKDQYHAEFNRPSRGNRSLWAKYVLKVEAVFIENTKTTHRGSPPSYTGKMLAVLTWSENEPFPPFPLLTESAVMVVDKMFGKVDRTITEVSLFVIKYRESHSYDPRSIT